MRREREPGPYSRHIASLDGLRGMAVLAVMASHLFVGVSADGNSLEGWFGSLLASGAIGVDLFFVLSGFLITGILYDSLSDSGFFSKFYARRTLRIFPLYYGILFILLALTPWLHLQWRKMEWVLLLYLQNTNLVMPFYQFSPGARIDLDHFWSLAVEEQFYLVWPLVVFLVRDLRKLFWTSVVLSCAALMLRLGLFSHHWAYDFVNRSTPCRADSLLIGAGLALALRSRVHDRILKLAPGVLLCSAGIYAAINLLNWFTQDPHGSRGSNPIFLSVRYDFFGIGSAALIAWCLRPASRVRAAFEAPALRFFGKYSYGLYVLHLLILGFTLRMFRAWIRYFTPSKAAGVLLTALLVFLISIAAAYLSYNLYEKQFLRLKHRFDYDRTKRLPTSAVRSEAPV